MLRKFPRDVRDPYSVLLQSMPSTYFRKDLLLVGKSYWKYRIPGMYSACFFENGQEKFFFNNINIAHQFNVAPNSFIKKQ